MLFITHEKMDWRRGYVGSRIVEQVCLNPRRHGGRAGVKLIVFSIISRSFAEMSIFSHALSTSCILFLNTLLTFI